MDDAVSIERRTAEETFALLGNDLRIDIVRALAADPETKRTFSDLREAVGMPDSGKFNYHLGKLTGQFVKRSTDGYELSLAGRQVVGALLAGTYTADAQVDPIAVTDPCPACGSRSLFVEYEDEHVTVHCTQCGDFYNEFTFPPGALDQYDREELPEVVDRWLWTEFSRIVSGFCPRCGGRMDGKLTQDGSADFDDPVHVQYDCPRCGDVATAAASLPVFFHPGVIGFLYDHGVNVTTEPTWRWPMTQDDLTIDLTATSPLKARIAIAVADDAVTAHVDETATVVSVERSDSGQK